MNEFLIIAIIKFFFQLIIDFQKFLIYKMYFHKNGKHVSTEKISKKKKNDDLQKLITFSKKKIIYLSKKNFFTTILSDFTKQICRIIFLIFFATLVFTSIITAKTQISEKKKLEIIS